jgi:tRNA uridine 5-carbamoylmethylation protein Kti12
MTLLLTGAPCAGKTETLHRLGDLLTRHGVRVVATPEVATELFLNERKLSAARFQQEVLERQLANEAAAAAQANY